MNISRLLTRTKSKTKFIFDLCTPNTLFLCFCETFLTDEIPDSELMIPDFTITRCDRRQRMGGGVCMYVKNSVNFTTCVSYFNSTCELLIVRLHDPSLIIVLIYRPPSCSTENFDDIINQVYQFIYSLATPLPNIIMLGDFNLPDVKGTLLKKKKSLLMTFIDFYCLINTRFWITNEKNFIKKNHF